MRPAGAKKLSMLSVLAPVAFALFAAWYSVEHSHRQVSESSGPEPNAHQSLRGRVLDASGALVTAPLEISLFDAAWLKMASPSALPCAQRSEQRLLDAGCEHAPEAISELLISRSLAVSALRKLETGGSGMFSFESIAPGRYVVGARREEGALTLTVIEVGTYGNADITLTFGANAALEGHVLDPEGRGISGAWVEAIDPRLGSTATVLTDVDGRFTFQRLERDVKYYVLARAANRAPAGRPDVAPGTKALELELEEATAIFGRVTLSGRPQAGTEIQLDDRPTREMSTANGEFSISNLTPGFHVLRAKGAAGFARRVELETPRGVARRVTLELAPACSILVRAVTESGDPVAYADIRLLARDSLDHRATRADARGVAVLDLLSLGDYAVDVRSPKGHRSASTLVVPAGCATRTEVIVLEPPKPRASLHH